MSEILIKSPLASDLAEVIKLIEEFAAFEKLSDACRISEKDLHDALFGAEKFADCQVAESENKIVAYAIFFSVFKTFRGERSMYLEDLYVSPAMRGKGLGLMMLKAVARKAKEKNCVRMDWQALKWNKKAIGFYEKIGAEFDNENLDFRLRGEAFLKLSKI